MILQSSKTWKAQEYCFKQLSASAGAVHNALAGGFNTFLLELIY
jgi:hypothetical protein